MTALEELQKTLGSKSTDPLTLAKAANKLDDADWKLLSESTQDWVNAFLKEHDLAEAENRDPNYPKLEGLANGHGGETEEFAEQPERTRPRYQGGATKKTTGRSRGKKTLSEETKRKIAASVRARHRAQGRGKAAKVAKAKPTKSAVKPVTAVATNGEYRITQTKDGFRVERVTSVPVGVFFDRATAESVVANLK